MLDKPDKNNPVIVDGKELAIGAHLTAALGQTRQLDLSVAIPLGWSDEEVNATLDRIVHAANRQKWIQDLEATKALLKNAEQDLQNHRVHRISKENEFVSAHIMSNKRGDWEANGSQKKMLDNLELNEKNTSEMIAKFRTEIEELEARCR